MKIQTADLARSAFLPEQLVRDDLPQVAFIGRSNVGKSSLLNRLLGRKKLARTSSTPGRTRAVHYFLVNQRLYFVDLPGYGYAKASKKDRAQWARLIEDYLAAEAGPRTAIQLVDAKVGATPLDVQALDYLTEFGVRPIVVPTKVDRVPRSRRKKMEKGVRDVLALDAEWPVVPVSSTTGEGTSEIWKRIGSFMDEQRQEARTS